MAQAKKKKLPAKKTEKKNSNKDEDKKEAVSKKQEKNQSIDVFKEVTDNEEVGTDMTTVDDKKSTEQEQNNKSKTAKKSDDKHKKIKLSKKAEKDSKKEMDTKTEQKKDDVEEEVDEVTAIYYVDDDGSRIDMTKMDQSRGKGKYIFGAIFIIGLLAIVAYLGYLVFNRDFGSTSGEVGLTVTAEDRVASGDVVTLNIEYINGESIDISSGQIEVLYPDGFNFQSASVDPSVEDERIWEIEDIKPGAGGKIRITGQLVGSKDDKKDFNVRLTYQPANFSHEFQITKTATVTIASSIVDVTIDAPKQAQSGQEITYKVEYENTSKVPLNDVKIVINYPKDFIFISSSEDAWSGNNEWRLNKLDAGEKRTLEITGTLDGDSGETKEFDFQLGIIEIDNSFNVQIQKTSLVVMANPEINLTIDAPELVSPGEKVLVTVELENISELELKDVKVELSMAGALFKKDKHSFKKINKLSPNQNRELQYETILKDDSLEKNQTLEITAKVVSAFVDGATVSFPNQATTQIKVKGDFSVTAAGRYYDDDLTKIGSGPVPPEVGSETVYIIRWNIDTGSNAISNLLITSSLPDDVIWEKDADQGIEYDSTTRTITYTKDKVKADSNTELDFAVRIAPTADDYNKLMVLANETSVTAIDGFTKEEISIQLEKITTDLSANDAAQGKGVVQGSSVE